jgi:hypothetical protein
MSFNRDPNKLDATPTFGGLQARAAFDDIPGRASGGKSRGPFTRNYKFLPGKAVWVLFHGAKIYKNVVCFRNPETGETETRIIEAPFIRGMGHYNASKNNFGVCSGGPDYYNKEFATCRCAGCVQYYAGIRYVDNKRETGPMGRDEFYGFSMTVLQAHYEVEGNRINPTTGAPYTEWVVLGDDRLKGKELSKLKSAPYMKYQFSASKTKFGQLLGSKAAPGASIAEALVMTCASCGQEDAFNGSMDMNAACVACEAVGKRVDLFSVAVQIVPVVTKAPSRPGEHAQTALTLKAWKPVPAELVGTDALEPLDLAEKFAPTPPEKQKQLWGAVPAITSEGITGSVPADHGAEAHPDLVDDIPFLSGGPCVTRYLRTSPCPKAGGGFLFYL